MYSIIPTHRKTPEYLESMARPANSPKNSMNRPFDRLRDLTADQTASSQNSINGVSGMMKMPVMTKA